MDKNVLKFSLIDDRPTKENDLDETKNLEVSLHSDVEDDFQEGEDHSRIKDFDKQRCI